MPDRDTPSPALTRPPGTCLTHRHSEGRGWVMAHESYKTCDGCYDRIRDTLKDITRRYLSLNARPGASTDHGSRGAPGFGSRPAASPHIISMRDWRSKSHEVAMDGIDYVWDPQAPVGPALARTLPGPSGRFHRA